MSDVVETDGRPKKFFQVRLDPNTKLPLHALAIRFGYILTVYGRTAQRQRGNVSALLTAIGNGDHQITSKLAQPENIQIINQIYIFIAAQQAFNIEVEKPEGNLVFECLCGKIIFDLDGKHILVAHTEIENIHEVPELNRNHSFFIDRILAVSYSNRSCSKNVPSVRVQFSIERQLNYNFHPDDVSTEEMLIPSRSIVVRHVFSSQNLIKELLSYGCNSCIQLPSSVRTKFLNELKFILKQYMSTVE